MKKATIVLLLLVAVIASSAHADRRSYVWTYQYMTMPEGETEIEFYQTTKLKATDEWEYRVEVETGMTDRWDFSVYQIFKQVEGDDLTWDAVQFRTRYRLGESGMWPVDPLIYLEYNRKVDLKKPNKFEGKLILAKQEGKLNISANPLYELFFAPGTEHEIGLDAGMSWEFHPRFVAGIESVSRQVLEDGADFKSYLGPTVSIASGRWWYSMGVVFGITDASDDARVRFLMGIGI